MNIEVNAVAVLVATIGAMAVGFLWYSPVLLGKPWMKEMGLTADKLKKQQSEMGKLYGISFLVALLTAFVLSHVMTLSQNFYGYPKLVTGLNTAFWIWIGFILPVQVTDQIFAAKKWKLLAINTGYQLVALFVMAIFLAVL